MRSKPSIGRPPYFEVQLGFALQKSDDVDAKFEPVFSLLPVDLYSLLLSLYGAVDRHTIKHKADGTSVFSVLMASIIPQLRSSS
jgi:hypothetical protein